MPLPADKIKLYFLAAVAGTVFIAGCGREKEMSTEKSRFLMGTYCQIKASGGKEVENSVERAMEAMEQVYEKFNHRKEKSLLYEFNNHSRPIEDREIISLAEQALDISRASGEAFDITVYPLVELWEFNTDSPSLPPDNKIKKTLENVGPEKIKISGREINKTKDAVKIDMGAIAKGYAVDIAAKLLKNEGVKSALIDAGGDIYAIGKNSGRKWKIGLQHPRNNEIIKVFEVSDRAVATSGDYENYFIQESKRYHHILDPRTGFPSSSAASVTVIAADTASADAWSTAFFVMQPEEAVKLARSLPDIECFIITPGMNFFKSDGIDDYLQ